MCNLPDRHVIHWLGPIYAIEEPSEGLLASCYRNVLQLAEQRKIVCIEFPGHLDRSLWYPVEPTAKVAFKTVLDMLPGLSSVKHIQCVLFHEADVRVLDEAMEELIGVMEELIGVNDAD